MAFGRWPTAVQGLLQAEKEEMGMAYCADSEVFAAIKEEAYNVLLGEEYIEDVNERKKRLQPLVEEAIEDAAI